MFHHPVILPRSLKCDGPAIALISKTARQSGMKRLLLVFGFLILVYTGTSTHASAELVQPPETLFIPAGPFVMGSDREEREAAYALDEFAYGHSRTRQWKWYENEARSTPHLEDFWISKNLVTNAEYRRFLKDTGHPPPDVSAGVWRSYKLAHPYTRTRKFSWKTSAPPAGRERHPVVLVSHSDVISYARWLSKKTGLVWTLPSEAQWEKAARGTDGRWYPWGNAFKPHLLNSHDQGPFDTVPVGQFPKGASPFGMLDAAGQVFEWTRTKAAQDRFIVKGGSWDDKGCGVCRPAARHGRPAFLKHILVGFRLVTQKPPSP